MFNDLLQRTFFGNTALSYIVVAGVIVVGLVVVRIITAVVIGALHRWAAKTAGKLLADTYREWKESRFAEGGVTCQNCHMPGRRHLFRGIHDPEMTRRAVTVRAEVLPGGSDESIRAALKITNSGAGHYLPTYVTPSIVVRGFLAGPGGAEIEGTSR